MIEWPICIYLCDCNLHLLYLFMYITLYMLCICHFSKMSYVSLYRYCISHVRVMFLLKRSYLPCEYTLCLDIYHWLLGLLSQFHVKTYFIGLVHMLFTISLVNIFSMLISEMLLFISEEAILKIYWILINIFIFWFLWEYPDCK